MCLTNKITCTSLLLATQAHKQSSSSTPMLCMCILGVDEFSDAARGHKFNLPSGEVVGGESRVCGCVCVRANVLTASKC